MTCWISIGLHRKLSRSWDRPLLPIYRIWPNIIIVCEKGMECLNAVLVTHLSTDTGRRLDCVHVTCLFLTVCVFYESCGTGGASECRGEGGPATVPGATHDSSFKSPDVMEESCSGSTPLALLLSSSFFHFMRRFWNQILMCLSVRLRVSASSTRRGREMYLLKRNSFSSSSSCALV